MTCGVRVRIEQVTEKYVFESSILLVFSFLIITQPEYIGPGRSCVCPKHSSLFTLHSSLFTLHCQVWFHLFINLRREKLVLFDFHNTFDPPIQVTVFDDGQKLIFAHIWMVRK